MADDQGKQNEDLRESESRAKRSTKIRIIEDAEAMGTRGIVFGEPRIVLRASKRVVEALSGCVDEIAHQEGFEGRIVVTADPAIKGADCRIEWRGGGAERSEAAIEHDLAAIIARRFPHSVSPEE